MSDDAQALIRLIGLSFSKPDEAARIVFSRRFDRPTLWLALALVTVLSVLLLAVSNVLVGVPPEMQEVAFEVTPWSYALILGSSLVMLVFALYFVGRMLGGTGPFPETLLCVIWLQTLSMALQVLQLLAVVIAAPLAGIVSLVGMGLILFSLINFVNVLHDFDSLWKSFGTFVLAILGIAVGLTVILSLIGVAAIGI